MTGPVVDPGGQSFGPGHEGHVGAGVATAVTTPVVVVVDDDGAALALVESVKRVASAAGEGAMAVALVHEHLARPTSPALEGAT